MKPITRPKGILFDLGDTLLQVKGFNLDGGIHRLRELTDQAELFNAAKLDETSEAMLRGTSYSYENSRRIGDDLGKASESIRFGANYEISFTAFHRNLFDRLGLTSKHSWEYLDLEFLKISHVFGLEQGVVEMLNSLKESDIRLGIVSNSFHGGKSLEWMLEQAGITNYFDFLISSADYGFRKPHPEIFETALTKLGVDRENVWFIGDKPEADVAGANSVGVTSVWYNADNAPPREPTPDLMVKSWQEFLDVIPAKSGFKNPVKA